MNAILGNDTVPERQRAITRWSAGPQWFLACRCQAGTVSWETWSKEEGMVQPHIDTRVHLSRHHLSPTRRGFVK